MKKTFINNQKGAALFEYLMGFSIVAVITVATVTVLMTDTQELAKKTTCRINNVTEIFQGKDDSVWKEQIKAKWQEDCSDS